MSTRNPLRRQAGLTLIELLVALAVALFMLGGLFTITMNTRNTFDRQKVLAQLQDSERLAMTIVGDVVQAAGYYPNPTVTNAAGALPALGLFVSPGQPMLGTSAVAAPGDTISVRYVTNPNDGIINCVGGTNTGAIAQLYVNVFSIDPAGNLGCSLNGLAFTPLVAGVQTMQIYYGVKTNFAAANGAVDSYLRANEMTVADWNNVVAVRVIITFLNPLAAQPGQPATINVERVIAVMSRTGVGS
jgi:type IV pilus assembly protein PilW